MSKFSEDQKQYFKKLSLSFQLNWLRFAKDNLKENDLFWMLVNLNKPLDQKAIAQSLDAASLQRLRNFILWLIESGDIRIINDLVKLLEEEWLQDLLKLKEKITIDSSGKLKQFQPGELFSHWIHNSEFNPAVCRLLGRSHLFLDIICQYRKDYHKSDYLKVSVEFHRAFKRSQRWWRTKKSDIANFVRQKIDETPTDAYDCLIITDNENYWQQLKNQKIKPERSSWFSYFRRTKQDVEKDRANLARKNPIIAAKLLQEYYRENENQSISFNDALFYVAQDSCWSLDHLLNAAKVLETYRNHELIESILLNRYLVDSEKNSEHPFYKNYADEKTNQLLQKIIEKGKVMRNQRQVNPGSTRLVYSVMQRKTYEVKQMNPQQNILSDFEIKKIHWAAQIYLRCCGFLNLSQNFQETSQDNFDEKFSAFKQEFESSLHEKDQAIIKGYFANYELLKPLLCNSTYYKEVMSIVQKSLQDFSSDCMKEYKHGCSDRELWKKLSSNNSIVVKEKASIINTETALTIKVNPPIKTEHSPINEAYKKTLLEFAFACGWYGLAIEVSEVDIKKFIVNEQDYIKKNHPDKQTKLSTNFTVRLENYTKFTRGLTIRKFINAIPKNELEVQRSAGAQYRLKKTKEELQQSEEQIKNNIPLIIKEFPNVYETFNQQLKAIRAQFESADTSDVASVVSNAKTLQDKLLRYTSGFLKILKKDPTIDLHPFQNKISEIEVEFNTEITEMENPSEKRPLTYS